MGFADRLVPEYWSIGVLDKNFSAVNRARFRQLSDMIIYLLNIIEHNQIQVGIEKSLQPPQ